MNALADHFDEQARRLDVTQSAGSIGEPGCTEKDAT